MVICIMKQHQESVTKMEYQGTFFTRKYVPGACKRFVALSGLIYMDCIFFCCSSVAL